MKQVKGKIPQEKLHKEISMSKQFIAANRQQAYLLPPSLDEWLPQEHLSRFILEIVEQLDLSCIYHGMSSEL